MELNVGVSKNQRAFLLMELELLGDLHLIKQGVNDDWLFLYQ